MHISLDSALGRQRRLNSVGESITQIAPDPAAAYSLRSLTGGDPKVVRVRRGSDNHEQDFTASDVSSGALQDFVNAQVVAPLDIQALSATGRDGDFLIAKAAYSLRSLGTRQATVAATGDTVARADGKYVCQVRRSPDDALKSFTATEITDGTLVDFATSGNGVFANTGYESFTNASATGFTASNTTGEGFAISDIADGVSGDVVQVSFDLDITNGSPKLSLRGSLSGGSQGSNAITYTTSGSKTGTLTATGNYVGIGFSEGDSPSNFTVSNFKILGDGFVKTWYDQSVTNQAGDTATGNHATQATAESQPKIVSAGTLLNELDFDGTEDMALATGSFSLTQAYTTFSVSHTDDASTSQGVWSTAPSISNQFNAVSFFRNDDGLAVNSGSTLTTAGTIDYVADRTYLQTNVVNGGSSSVFVDGVTGVTGDAGSNNPSGILILGFYRVSSANQNLDGGIKELIIYDSDQSDNRTAIEANIGEVYSIDLPSGVDPGFDQVDGFVETWYDQSGNGNDVVQATAANQPKIVNAGTLLNELSFDGTADVLKTSESSTFSQPVSLFHVFNSSETVPSDYQLNAGGSSMLTGGDGSIYYFAGSLLDSTIDFPTSGDTLHSVLFNGASSTVHADGTSVASGDIGSGTFSKTFAIGGRTNDSQFSDMSFKEIIIYNSDQSSNRTALEANINSHYSIF